ncbi:carbon-nitrogen hydrolase family protein [Arsukibacterium indicum]|uniref:Carbon-nitrogen hydrolase family protein n=1 Tax=Arsukibacterium indicum TaxID=2848612 RepID=A0ABS6MNV9_9GAMM|nr:carbon-nitrogen hydrolase family protein [Arsukibacterium indicum]MBV2130471.1 carbon-nitrogen hydrolase family protein [Arsukibacterium indicum]
MATNWRLSAIQLTSGPEPAANLAAVRQHLQQLPQAEQHLVLLPECFAVFGGGDKLQLAHQAAIGEGAIQRACAQLARQFSVYLVAGSQPTTTADPNRFAASCLVYSPQGELLADYQKLHLFDVNVADSTGSYRESATTLAGQKISLCQLPGLKLGLSICYDVRFPGLMQALAVQGMQLLTVPSAFTRPTGGAHWHTLLKARAIENQCFVLAANQTGVHANGRETFGHSLIIDPWGEVLADAGTDPGWVSALVDLNQCRQLGQKMPVHQHNRFNSELK